MTIEARMRANNASVKRSFGIAVIVALALGILAIAVAAILGTPKDLNGALIGASLALVVVVPSYATALWGLRGSFLHLIVMVLGAWLVKMLVVVVVLALIQHSPSISMKWVGIALLAGAIVPTVLEGVLLLKSRTSLEV